MVRSIASFMLSWLSSMLCQVGQLASSKSAIQQLAPELSAFMVILRSGGPVSSTRRSCRSSGMGAIFQSRSLTSLVSGRKSGISPALILSCRSARFCRSSTTLPLYSRLSSATKATASGVSICWNSSGISAVNSIPSAYVRVPSVMTSGSSLQLPERGYSSKPSPGTLGADSLSSRPNSPTTLPGNPVHVNDARGRNTTPPVENPVLVKPYPNPRPNGRRALLVTTLQDLLRLRVPVLYRNQSFPSQSLRHNRKIPTSQILVQSFAHIVDIGETYTS